MFVDLTVEKKKATHPCAGGAAGSDKAARLRAAVQSNFEQHKATHGAKTLLAIAFSIRS